MTVCCGHGQPNASNVSDVTAANAEVTAELEETAATDEHQQRDGLVPSLPLRRFGRVVMTP